MEDLIEGLDVHEDIAIEELAETSGAGTAFTLGCAGCPSSAGTASSFG